MKAEVLSAVVGDNYAEAAEHGSGGSRGVFLSGDRLVVWVERGGRRKILLDVLLDKHHTVALRIKKQLRHVLLLENQHVC